MRIRKQLAVVADPVAEPLLDAALRYVNLGIPVFPCSHKNKQPLTPHGFKDATCEQAIIREWWTNSPHAMIGVPTGEISGIDVVDIDVDKNATPSVNGFQALPQWRDLSPMIVRSPRGGAHLWFRAEGKLRNSTNKIAPGIDTRGEGGYIIVPPSSSSIGDYHFERGGLGDICRLSPVPAEILALLGSHDGCPSEQFQADPGEIAAALNSISNHDLGWEDWNRIGMATWRATGSSSEGFEAFDTWPRKSSKYNAEATRKRCETYSRSPPTQIGAGTIFHLAKEAKSAQLDELAKLDRVAYDQARKQAAKDLGVRPFTLDKEVAERRELGKL
jgi:Bifunctional DNA primase/polymerase, N-terminal/Primase C terminal 2 (PriCT-2)